MIGMNIRYGAYGKKERRRNAQAEKKSNYKGPDSTRRVISANNKLLPVQSVPPKRGTGVSSKNKAAKRQRVLVKNVLHSKQTTTTTRSGRVVKRPHLDYAKVDKTDYASHDESSSKEPYSETSDDSYDKHISDICKHEFNVDINEKVKKESPTFHYPPLMLKWFKNSCFIHSLIQCFISSEVLSSAILNSDETWSCTDRSVLFQLALIIHDMKSKYEVLDQLSDDIHTQTGMDIIEDDVGGHTAIVLYKEVELIMELLDEGTTSEYRKFGFGDLLFLVDFLRCELTHVHQMPNHPLFHSWSMASHCVRHRMCPSCGEELASDNTAMRVGDSSFYLTSIPSDERGRTLPSMLKWLTTPKTVKLDKNDEVLCKCCHEIMEEVVEMDKFQDIDADRVLMVNVRPVEANNITLDEIHTRYDFSPFVDRQSKATKYEATLLSYIYMPTNSHFACVVRSRDGSEFYDVDDLSDKLPISIGLSPNELWSPPTFMFYSIRPVVSESKPPVNAAPFAELHTPSEIKLSGDPAMLESNLPLDVGPIAGLPTTTRSNDRVEERDREEIVLSDDTKTESLQPPWQFISPIGRRGYRFERRFDAGWFRGEVMNHVDGFGKITDKFDPNTGKRSIDRGWSFCGRCCY